MIPKFISRSTSTASTALPSVYNLPNEQQTSHQNHFCIAHLTMASKLPQQCLTRARLPSTCLRSIRLTSTSSTTPSIPPLLLKLRSDLKTAMKSKDTARLNVLKGLLADITNASKTSIPAKTDMQIVSLLRKRSTASKAAAEEFKAAKRDDLVEKEEEQVRIMEGYVGEIVVVGEEEIKTSLRALKSEMNREGSKVDKGSLIRKLIGPGGKFDGQNIEAKTVARLVQAELGS